jgi:hypothetical protein
LECDISRQLFDARTSNDWAEQGWKVIAFRNSHRSNCCTRSRSSCVRHHSTFSLSNTKSKHWEAIQVDVTMDDTVDQPDGEDGPSKDLWRTVEAVAMLLSASHLDAEIPRDQEFSSMTGGKMEELDVICPSLSLHHDKEKFGVSQKVDRKLAEDRAVDLLSRPVRLRHGECQPDDTKLRMSCFGADLLQNIYSSFAVLVDCRLRAYSDLLARHVAKLTIKKKRSKTDDAALPEYGDNAVRVLGEKLEAMYAIASKVEATAIVTQFTLENIELDAAVSAMLRFHVSINLKIPGIDEAMLVEFHTPGTMTGRIAL